MRSFGFSQWTASWIVAASMIFAWAMTRSGSMSPRRRAGAGGSIASWLWRRRASW